MDSDFGTTDTSFGDTSNSFSCNADTGFTSDNFCTTTTTDNDYGTSMGHTNSDSHQVCHSDNTETITHQVCHSDNTEKMSNSMENGFCSDSQTIQCADGTENCLFPNINPIDTNLQNDNYSSNLNQESMFNDDNFMTDGNNYEGNDVECCSCKDNPLKCFAFFCDCFGC